MDTDIRLVTLTEQADAAARRAVETGEEQPNPHAGTDDEAEFARRYFVALQRLQVPAECEGGA